MDDGFWIAIIILGFTILFVAGIIIHEVLETPYDKCLNGCEGLEEKSEPECVKSCSITFCEDKEEDLK